MLSSGWCFSNQHSGCCRWLSASTTTDIALPFLRRRAGDDGPDTIGDWFQHREIEAVERGGVEPEHLPRFVVRDAVDGRGHRVLAVRPRAFRMRVVGTPHHSCDTRFVAPGGIGAREHARTEPAVAAQVLTRPQRQLVDVRLTDELAGRRSFLVDHVVEVLLRAYTVEHVAEALL